MTQLQDRPINAPTRAGLPAAALSSEAGLLNFRPAAATDRTADMGTTAASATQLLFRSGAPKFLGGNGAADLVQSGIRTVVDLREPEERAAIPNVVQESLLVLNRPIYRAPAPVSMPMPEVYRHLLLGCSDAVVDAVRTIIRHLDSGVLVHCAAGKDRTGVVVAVLLAAAGLDRTAIVRDYSLSAESLPAEFRRRTVEKLQFQIQDPQELQTALHLHLTSPAAAIEAVLDLLERHYGGAAAYLITHGADTAEVQRAGALLNPSAIKV